MISEAPAFSPRGVNQSATIMKATDSQMKSIGSIGLPQVSSLNRKPFTMTPNNLLECAGYLLLMTLDDKGPAVVKQPDSGQSFWLQGCRYIKRRILTRPYTSANQYNRNMILTSGPANAENAAVRNRSCRKSQHSDRAARSDCHSLARSNSTAASMLSRVLLVAWLKWSSRLRSKIISMLQNGWYFHSFGHCFGYNRTTLMENIAKT